MSSADYHKRGGEQMRRDAARAQDIERRARGGVRALGGARRAPLRADGDIHLFREIGECPLFSASATAAARGPCRSPARSAATPARPPCPGCVRDSAVPDLRLEFVVHRRLVEAAFLQHQHALGAQREFDVQAQVAEHVGDDGTVEAIAQRVQVPPGVRVPELARVDGLEQLHVGVEVRLEPLAQRLLAVLEREIDQRRQQHQDAERREHRLEQQRVVDGVQQRRGDEPGPEHAQPAVRVPLGERDRDDREHGRRAAVHDRCAEAADDLHRRMRFRARHQVVEVFEQREAGADREPVDRRIDDHADAPGADQVHDQRGLERSSSHGETQRA